MAVDQHGEAEAGMGACHQPLQRVVIGLVDRLDAADRLGERQPARIDVEPLADQLRHGAKPAGDARRADVGEGRHRLGEHARVEFPRLAVDVEIGAREIGGEQRRAERHGAAEQLVDDSNLPSGGSRSRSSRAIDRKRSG